MADDRKDPDLEQSVREVPIDWDALENAFENNAPEVHSYLHLVTGDVLRVVDGVADPQMHALIASDPRYLRIEPVSSREQYSWMEKYIPTLEDADIRAQLTVAIDGKGAFRRFKDVLMSYGPERERWFAYRSENLRKFMTAWLEAHNIKAVPRRKWSPPPRTFRDESERSAPHRLYPERHEHRRVRNVEVLRRRLREAAEKLGARDLDTLLSFAEFLRARRASRAYHVHHDVPTSGSSSRDSAPDLKEEANAAADAIRNTDTSKAQDPSSSGGSRANDSSS